MNLRYSRYPMDLQHYLDRFVSELGLIVKIRDESSPCPRDSQIPISQNFKNYKNVPKDPQV